MIVTNTGAGDKPTFVISAGVVAIAKGGVTITKTLLPNGEIVGGQLNFGLGLPAGSVPANASVGISNTWILADLNNIFK